MFGTNKKIKKLEEEIIQLKQMNKSMRDAHYQLEREMQENIFAIFKILLEQKGSYFVCYNTRSIIHLEAEDWKLYSEYYQFYNPHEERKYSGKEEFLKNFRNFLQEDRILYKTQEEAEKVLDIFEKHEKKQREKQNGKHN